MIPPLLRRELASLLDKILELRLLAFELAALVVDSDPVGDLGVFCGGHCEAGGVECSVGEEDWLEFVGSGED